MSIKADIAAARLLNNQAVNRVCFELEQLISDRRDYQRNYMRDYRARRPQSHIDELAKAVATERIKALCRQAKAKPPRGQDLRQAVTNIIEAQRQDIYAEAAARMTLNSAAAQAAPLAVLKEGMPKPNSPGK